MRFPAAKLAFIHRTLWRRNPAYRWAVLLGPPPLLGCVLATLALAIWQHVPYAAPAPGANAPWAHWNRPLRHEDQPYTEPMTAALPQKDAAGRFPGFEPGWLGNIRPMSVDATMDVDVIASTIASLTLEGPTIPLSRILDAGPPSGLFVGTVRTFFVVQAPGVYVFSAQLAWSGMQSANCVVRLGSAHHGIIRNVNANIASQSVLSYPSTEFRLSPGLLLLQVAVGCWRGDQAVAPGTLTVLVRRPGELGLTPLAASEVIRPRQAGPAGGR